MKGHWHVDAPHVAVASCLQHTLHSSLPEHVHASPPYRSQNGVQRSRASLLCSSPSQRPPMEHGVSTALDGGGFGQSGTVLIKAQ
jgi:hypothetical protein